MEPEPSRQNKGGHRIPERPDLELLAIGKKMGLSFDEINMLRVRDLIAFARIVSGAERDKPRKATQADIDKFFGR